MEQGQGWSGGVLLDEGTSDGAEKRYVYMGTHLAGSFWILEQNKWLDKHHELFEREAPNK